jgi:predicted TIM-barrel fold metal-dependent hydrolase
MAVDGVCQEVLYPSFALSFFSLKNAELQQACFRAYNDWLSDYCSVAEDQLFGIAALSTYNIEHAVAELNRCKTLGFVGAMVWEVPPSDLAFSTDHYDPLWQAAADLEMPMSLHILTGEGYEPRGEGPTPRRSLSVASRHVNDLIFETTNALADMIGSGALDRFPTLRLVLVECEASWIPSYLSQWDKYFNRQNVDSPMAEPPSAYFTRQVYATFFNDPTIADVLAESCMQKCMWSNDYPHPNSTWPNSRMIIERDLGGLPEAQVERLVRGTARDLYQLPNISLSSPVEQSRK